MIETLPRQQDPQELELLGSKFSFDRYGNLFIGLNAFRLETILALRCCIGYEFRRQEVSLEIFVEGLKDPFSIYLGVVYDKDYTLTEAERDSVEQKAVQDFKDDFNSFSRKLLKLSSEARIGRNSQRAVMHAT